MKIDNYINSLRKLRQEHGADMEVYAGHGGKAKLPRIEHFVQGSRLYLFINGVHNDKDKGDKAVHL